MAKISVIIPIYKVEKYLEQTLASVTNQTWTDLEILCVNDCSPDGCGEIIESFAQKDSRIRRIDLPENLGAGLARKAGILASTGDYVMFLDGDDFYRRDACRKAYRGITRKNVDILQFRTHVIPSSDALTGKSLRALRSVLNPYPNTLRFEQTGELVRACFEENLFGYTLANKIFKGDIIRKAAAFYEDERFDITEDLYLFYLTAMTARSYGSIQSSLYCYRCGAEITGGKPATNPAMENLIRQGRILRLLQTFSATQDPDGITNGSLKALGQRFLGDVTYSWGSAAERPDWRQQLPMAMDCFDLHPFLGSLMEFYAQAGYRDRSAIMEVLKSSGSFDAVPHTGKTVATFYHRMYNGGLERVLSKLIPMWTQMGYRVILFTDEPATEADYPYGQNITRVLLPKVKNRTAEEFTHRISVLTESLQHWHVDLMVYHAWVSQSLAADLLTVKSLHIPFIVHTHGFFGFGHGISYPPEVVWIAQLQTTYSLADAVVTLSETDYSWWTMLHPRVYRTLNPPTFDLKQIRSIPERTEYPYDILWIARISEEKQPIDALRILKKVLDSGVNATLHIVGKYEVADYADRFNNAIQSYGLSEHVVLHGYQEDVRPFYRGGKLLLFTSEFEGFPMTLVESLSYGVPVVMYDLPNIDLARNNPGLAVVPQNDAAAAAAAIVRILTQPETRSAMSRAARRSAEEAYSLDLPAHWQKIFDDVSNLRPVPSTIRPEMLCNALRMLNDFTAEGIEAREVTHTRTNTESNAEAMLKQYKNGDAGLRWALQYIIAWLQFKLTRKRRGDTEL